MCEIFVDQSTSVNWIWLHRSILFTSTLNLLYRQNFKYDSISSKFIYHHSVKLFLIFEFNMNTNIYNKICIHTLYKYIIHVHICIIYLERKTGSLYNVIGFGISSSLSAFMHNPISGSTLPTTNRYIDDDASWVPLISPCVTTRKLNFLLNKFIAL